MCVGNFIGVLFTFFQIFKAYFKNVFQILIFEKNINNVNVYQ